MIWFWSRDEQHTRLEARYDNATTEFVVAITYANGGQQSERFLDIGAFQTRLEALERGLQSEHWAQSAGPFLDPQGFPNRRLAPEFASQLSSPDRAKTLAKRTYSVGTRTFEIFLCGMRAGDHPLWTVGSVVETTPGGRFITIPGMDEISASTEDLAFARACNRIDKWLMSNR